MAEKPKGPQAGHICIVCEAPIPVLEMIILTITGIWCVQHPDMPQLMRQHKMHEACVATYIKTWNAENTYGGTTAVA